MEIIKQCFVLSPNLTYSFVNKPLINLLVGSYKTDVIKLINLYQLIKS